MKAFPMSDSLKKSVNLGRHSRYCKVCHHGNRAEIEADFVNWKSLATIAKEFGLRNRMNIYRHAYALGLFEKRRRNLRAVLERIVERVDEVEVNAAAVISAVQALAKINIQGQWVERTGQVNLNELFERMSQQELEAYAREGELPEWFTRTVGVTVKDSANGKYDE
jgi:hypothetical protein